MLTGDIDTITIDLVGTSYSIGGGLKWISMATHFEIFPSILSWVKNATKVTNYTSHSASPRASLESTCVLKQRPNRKANISLTVTMTLSWDQGDINSAQSCSEWFVLKDWFKWSAYFFLSQFSSLNVSCSFVHIFFSFFFFFLPVSIVR